MLEKQHKLMFLQEMADAINNILLASSEFDIKNKDMGVTQMLAFFDSRLGSKVENIKFMCNRINMMMNYQYKLVVLQRPRNDLDVMQGGFPNNIIYVFVSKEEFSKGV